AHADGAVARTAVRARHDRQPAGRLTMGAALAPANVPDALGDLPFSRRDFAAIARIMDEDAGVTLGASKMTLVYSRLAKRVRALGLGSFGDYCDRLEEDREERARVVQALVTHHTSFFREAHHFAFLEQRLAPRLIRRAREGGRVRLWSAGCS